MTCSVPCTRSHSRCTSSFQILVMKKCFRNTVGLPGVRDRGDNDMRGSALTHHASGGFLLQSLRNSLGHCTFLQSGLNWQVRIPRPIQKHSENGRTVCSLADRRVSSNAELRAKGETVVAMRPTPSKLGCCVCADGGGRWLSQVEGGEESGDVTS